MTNDKFVCLVYQKDFSGKGNDRYFIYGDGRFAEVDSKSVVCCEDLIVTHDYWLIANALYREHGRLPIRVLEITLLSRIIVGTKAIPGDVQPWDISETIRPLYRDKGDFDRYIDMYYRRVDFKEESYMLFSHKLDEYTNNIRGAARLAGEWFRFYNVELPLFNVLSQVAAKGLRVSQPLLKEHKNNIKMDYYRTLKEFSKKHGVLCAMPSKGDIKDKLRSLDFNVDSYGVKFLVDCVPDGSGYTEDLKRLQKLRKSFRVLGSIADSSETLRPIVETHSTSTSRMYYKDPNVQNIGKRYRDIFIADDGLRLSYVDYDQFEVGIMAALSDDDNMKQIYGKADAYVDLSEAIFGDIKHRKLGKIWFLSYTYGMSIERIIDSVRLYGGDECAAMRYFSKFVAFEGWKTRLHLEIEEVGRIPTICGNYLNRRRTGELSKKEGRSVVSHVVQGTGSFIFKSALLALSKQEDVGILIPMHDAVLIQHLEPYNVSSIVAIFQDTMTSILDKKVVGKASIKDFCG